MTLKETKDTPAIEERLSALLTNAAAVRAVSQAVESTLGPKGLDTMLVDRFGEITVTNAGVAILENMDVTHPAARMMINIAKSQHEQIGDGTTTAVIMASALVNEGLNFILKGVPTFRIIEGIKTGLSATLSELEKKTLPIRGMDDGRLAQVSLVAGRGNEEIARHVVDVARLVGEEKLRDPGFRLSDTIFAREGVDSRVLEGVILGKPRLNGQMPREVTDAPILMIDDTLAPEEVEDQALRTEAGFARYLSSREEFKRGLERILALGVKLVLVARGIDSQAEELLGEAGVMVAIRVPAREMRKIAEHTGAKPVKRMALGRNKEDLQKILGFAHRAYEEEKDHQVHIIGGAGKPMATFLLGAATGEVLQERERMANDAACALQAAVRGGVVPGGGAVELALSRKVMSMREDLNGMSVYGLDCLAEALRRPMAQIITNCGFNPLEKIEEVVSAQARTDNPNLGINCATGEIIDMLSAGIVDPALVKMHALRAAGEVAEAILRINTIIKMKDKAQDGK